MGIIGTIAATSVLSGLSINWNLLIALSIMCVTAMGVLIKVFGKKLKPEEKAGNGFICQQNIKDITRLESEIKSNSKNHDELKEKVNQLKTQTATLKVQSENNTKSLDEMKQDTREIVQRLDDLLKQLVEWLNE